MKDKWIILTCLVLSLFLVAGLVSAQGSGYGYLKGKIMTSDGESLSGGSVLFFDVKTGPSPFTRDYWRNKDFIFLIGKDGQFSAQLPEGTYYMMAMKKVAGGKTGGPPGEGDIVYPPFDGREAAEYVVKSGVTNDIGVISESVAFKKEWDVKGKSAIEGTVFNLKGEPVEGKLVIASSTPNVEKPHFLSDRRTDAEGKYIVRVPEEGIYYLRVRGHRQPVVSADVKDGTTIKGIDVHLTKKR